MRWQDLFPRRLDRQVMLLVILFLGFVMPIFALHEANENAERLVASTTLRAKALAENVAVTGMAHIVIYDFTSIEQLLLRSARFPGVMEIQVTDTDGRVMGDVHTETGNEPQLRYEEKQLLPPKVQHSQVENNDDALVIWEPVNAAKTIGWVRLKYSLVEAEAIAKQYLYDYLLDSVIVTILLLALILMVMQRPMRMLRNAAIFAGELTNKSGKQMPVDNRSIEVEKLGDALNAASRNLFEQEATIKQMTDHLEELVRRRTSELEEANKKLQHLTSLKSELVSVVSHELRTPLTSIKSFAEILKEDVESIDIETQKRFLSIINEESDRLGRLINDLLDLQKMESGKAVWKDVRVNIADILKRSVELFSQTYLTKGLELRFEPVERECLLNVDADRIKQLIDNLLSNALKFTERGGVTVAMSASAAEIIVTVTDSGVGIPERDIYKVFESFYQVDSSEKRKASGSGLGLAICKEIIDHYHGRIWVESNLGKGSCFAFALPLTANGTAG